MLWIIRRILQLCIIGLIILVIVAIAAVFLVDPTNYKDQLSKNIQKHTGYAFGIKGPVEWTFSPKMALKFKDVTLAGPEGFKSPVIEAKEVHVIVNPYSLFSSDLIVNKLDAKDVIITIEQSDKGKRNIDSMSKMSSESLSTLTIIEVSLNNVSILYQDANKNINWALNNAIITTNNIQLNPTTKIDPIALKGTVTNLNTNFSFDAETTIKTDLEKKTLTFDQSTLNIGVAKIKGASTISRLNDNPEVTGSFTLDPMDINAVFGALSVKADSDTATTNETPVATQMSTDATGKIQGAINFVYTSHDNVLDIKDFSLQANDGILRGNFKSTLISPYQTEFDVTVNKINLQPILALVRSTLPAGPLTQDINSNLSAVKTLTMSGKLAITESKVNNLVTITQLTAHINAKDKILNIMPVTLNAMGGTHNMGLILDLSGDLPKVKFNVQSDNLTIAEYLKILNYPSTFMGSATAKISLEGTGNDVTSLRQSANGGINLNIKAGAIDGVYLDKLLGFGVSSLNDAVSQVGAGADMNAVIKAKEADWSKNQQGTPSTKFDMLDMKSDVKQGSAKAVINMTSNSYDVKATGSFSLVDGKADYAIKAIDKDLPTNTMAFVRDYVNQNPLNISAIGPMGQLTYKPDLQSFIQNGITQIQAQLNKRAISNMVDSTGASTMTSKSAEQIFVDAMKDIGN